MPKIQIWIRSINMNKLRQISDIPIVGGGAMSAPIWMSYIEQLNTLVATLTGVIGLIYVSCRLYYLIKNKGKEHG